VNQSIKTAASNVLICAGIILPPAFLFAMATKYMPNIPFLDDYDVILHFILKYQNADSFWTSLSLFFEQHNEHRIAFGKLITLLVYHIWGQLDLRLLTFLGNLGLIGCLLVLYKMISIEQRDKFLYFVPISLLLFQFQYVETILWAMAALSNIFVLFFALLSLHMLNTEGRLNFLVAFLLAVLASFTQGMGIFTFAAAALLLVVKKNVRRFVVWLFLSGMVLGLYFVNYQKPPENPGITIFVAPLSTFKYFVTFLGSSFPFPFFAGLFFIAFFLFMTWKGYFKKNSAVYCGLVLIFLAAAAAALTRSNLGVEQAISSRYRIVSVLMPIFTYIFLVENYQDRNFKRFIFPVALIGSLVFNILSSSFNYNYFRSHNVKLRAAMMKWNMGIKSLYYHDKEGVIAYLLKQWKKAYTSRTSGDFTFRVPSPLA